METQFRADERSDLSSNRTTYSCWVENRLKGVGRGLYKKDLWKVARKMWEEITVVGTRRQHGGDETQLDSGSTQNSLMDWMYDQEKPRMTPTKAPS